MLLLTSVGAFMTPLDGSIVSVALPAIGPALRLRFTDAIWVQASYLLAISILLIPFGRLADAHGRLRFYLAGVVVFTIGSTAAALSVDALWLIAARCLQGAGGALLGATSAALVTAAFPPSERGRVLGINVTAVYLGLAVGPPLGGVLVDQLGWRWIFLVNIPIGIATFIMGWRLLKAAGGRRLDASFAAEISAISGSPSALSVALSAVSALRAQSPSARRIGASRAVDLPGAGLLGLMLAALLVPLTLAPLWGWSSVATIGLLALSAVALVAFVIVEGRVSEPMLDLDLLRRNRLFAAANLAALLNYMAMHGVTVLTAVFLEVVQHRPAQDAGLLLLAQPALMAALSSWAGRLSDRIGSRAPATAGMAIVAAGMSLLAFMPSHASTARVMLSLAVVGVGMAAFSTPNTSAVMGSVDRSRLGVASAFVGTMRFTGQALSVAVLGGIAASQLGSAGSKVLLLGGPVAATGGAARAAAAIAAADYADGYRWAMLVGAVLALIGAAVSLVRPSQTSAS